MHVAMRGQLSWYCSSTVDSKDRTQAIRPGVKYLYPRAIWLALTHILIFVLLSFGVLPSINSPGAQTSTESRFYSKCVESHWVTIIRAVHVSFWGWGYYHGKA